MGVEMTDITIRRPWLNADDYGSLQEALDAAVEASPSRLVLPPGVYECERLTVQGGNVEVFGPGATLRLAPGAGSAPTDTGTLLTVTAPERFSLDVGLVDGNPGVTTETGKALVQIHAAPGGATRSVTWRADTLGRQDHQMTIFIGTAGLSEAGTDVRVSGLHEGPGHLACVHVRGAHRRVLLDRVTYRDPHGHCQGHGFEVTGEATIDDDAPEELVVRDFMGEWASRDMMFLQNCRHIRIDGFVALHQGWSIHGPADSKSQPIKVDHYRYRAGYTCVVEGLVTRDSHPTQAFSSVWLAEGVRGGVVSGPDVDANVYLGAVAQGDDDDGLGNHLMGGCLRNAARVVMAPGSIVSGTRFIRDDGGTGLTTAIQTSGDGCTVRGVYLSGYRQVFVPKSVAAVVLDGMEMDETCEIYHARSINDPLFLVMRGVHGGSLNIQAVGAVGPNLRLEMSNCSTRLNSPALRSKLEGAATSVCRDNYRWDGSAFCRVINDTMLP